MQSPIFLCGHRKSGTSVFKSLFDNHPDLIVYPMDLNILYLYFPDFINKHKDYNTRKNRLKKVLFDDLDFFFQELKISPNFSIKKFSNLFFDKIGNELGDIKIIIETLFNSFIEICESNNLIPVFKETSSEIYFNEINLWFPNSKFIQLVRDPRDNYAALKSGKEKYYSKFGETEMQLLASLIHRTRLGTDIGILLSEKLPNRFLTLKFEDLLLNKEIEIKKACNFLGINFDKTLLNTTILGQNYPGNNFNNKTFKDLSSENLGKWKTRINEREAKIIEFNLEKMMNNFGYQKSFDIADCIPDVSEFYKYENYKFYYNERFN